MANPPNWVTNSFLENCLTKYYEQQILVPKIMAVTSAVNAVGDNFAGDIFRIKCQVKKSILTEEISLILKCLPENDNRKEYVNACGGFVKEVEMYSKTLPAMQKILQRFPNIERNIFWPNCYSAQFSYPEHILLEDLSQEGFVSPIKHKGLDMSRLTVALKNLAKFHALSVILHEQDPSSMNPYKIHGFCTDRSADFHERLASNGIRFLSEYLKSWPVSQTYLEKLATLPGKIIETLKRTVEPKNDDFCVLNHGDLWLTNVLFQSNGSLKAKFVDFQLSYYSSPVLDLHFFFLSSPVSDIRENHLSELFEIYHSELVKCFNHLGFQKPVLSLQNLKENFLKRDFLRFYHSITDLPMILSDENDEYNFDAYIQEGQGHKCNTKVFARTEYLNIMAKSIPQFIDEGVI